MSTDKTVDHSNIVPVKECDFLEQDAPIRGQNYVCMSFVSPEDVIQDKEQFVFQEFMKKFASDMHFMFDSLRNRFEGDRVVSEILTAVEQTHDYIHDVNALKEHYNVFKSINGERLDSEYSKANGFRTSIRGIKIRGSYESMEEARNRAAAIRRVDDKFDVFVGEVGCWCPWSPDPADIKDQEHAESQLNTMVKQYRENQELSIKMHKDRVNEAIKSGNNGIGQYASSS